MVLSRDDGQALIIPEDLRREEMYTNITEAKGFAWVDLQH